MEIARACIPYTPFKRDLKDARVALMTTAGAYVDGMEPFHEENDLSFRRIPADSETKNIRFVPGHFNVADAEKDPNCLFPLDRLRELLDEGVIGKIGEYHVSMGLTTELRKLKEEVSWEIARVIDKTRADVVVLTGG